MSMNSDMKNNTKDILTKAKQIQKSFIHSFIHSVTHSWHEEKLNKNVFANNFSLLMYDFGCENVAPKMIPHYLNSHMIKHSGATVVK